MFKTIGFVEGQLWPGNAEQSASNGQKAGFNGVEPASWQLALRRADTKEGAKAYAQELVGIYGAKGLTIQTISTHLQGQALGDDPSARTLQFFGPSTPPVREYVRWREKGGSPPKANPFYVTPEVGMLLQKEASRDMIAATRLCQYIGELQGNNVVMTSFVGSPAGLWSCFFQFPPLPTAIGGQSIPSVHEAAAELLVQRFSPVQCH